MTGIGTLRESALHAGLKAWYARPGDVLEAGVDGYVVDILRRDLVVEIQTHNFPAVKRKLRQLAESHPVRLVHPIAREKWIVRVRSPGAPPLGRRKSPRRGRIEDLFLELVSFPDLVAHPNFSLEVLLTQEEEVRCPAKRARRGRWPKAWRTCDRRLLQVVDSRSLSAPEDFRAFLPADLAQPFTSRDLARALDQPDYAAQKMTYCLRHMGTIKLVGKRGNAHLYEAI